MKGVINTLVTRYKNVLLPLYLCYKRLVCFYWDIEKKFIKFEISNPYLNCWLICDREFYADDNGEHLYRFIQQNHPEIKAYFLLNKNSRDWPRLTGYGFDLIAFGSKEHKEALKYCSKLVSSQADNHIVNCFGEHTDWRKKFVFLQHGVTMNDLSSWLSTKNISLLITSTRSEYNYFVSQAKRYNLSPNSIKLLGMPRHDYLLKLSKKKKVILIAPTWRKYLGYLEDEQLLSDKFLVHWREFFNSQELECLSKTYGYDVVFYPHPLLRTYIKFLNVPSYIKLNDCVTCSIQNLLATAAILITDYSSLSFEMGLLIKPVLYYQFDYKETFMSGSHTMKVGYFSYIRDGFGDVAITQDHLFMCLQKWLEKDCLVQGKLYERMLNSFEFRDQKNCQRVFDAILRL